eukprot:CAMPEP_0173076086 /NCGR_PEP_ID=MMETSP1102-20130122/12132_1 /TAXON_ID=49646 /ORGANISM="Geminigera sp., Strain Caron Lab Isolate" /LENGTH=116 /DNA_ID=CAMNT_0013945737 /DNA_START=297 /DNA_END=644 /DNA_ORIENTATION=+
MPHDAGWDDEDDVPLAFMQHDIHEEKMEPELRQRKPQKAKFGSVIAIESADTADSNEEESEDNDNEEEEDDEEDGSHLNPILVMVFFIVVELFWFRGGIFIAVPCTILLEGLGSGW